jgi:hypothetical protein
MGKKPAKKASGGAEMDWERDEQGRVMRGEVYDREAAGEGSAGYRNVDFDEKLSLKKDRSRFRIGKEGGKEGSGYTITQKCKEGVRVDQQIREDNVKRREDGLLHRTEKDRRDLLESAKFVDKLNKEKKMRELSAFQRQQKRQNKLNQQLDVSEV